MIGYRTKNDRELEMSLRASWLYLLRRWVDYYFDRFGPIRILFLIRNKMGWRCVKPLILALAERPGVRLAIALENDGGGPWPIDGEDRDLFERHAVSISKAAWRKWHYAICTDAMLTYLKWNAVKVLVPHGNVIGNMDSGKKKGHRWQTITALRPGIVLMDSVNALHAIRERQPAIKDSADILMILAGSPKMDRLFNLKGAARAHGLNALGLPADRRTIVLTSHWTELSVLRSLGRELVETLASLQNRYNIILTGHELLWHNPTIDHPAAPLDLIERMEELARAAPHVQFVKWPDDLAALLACGDLFICDHSSVLVEACILNKPILFFNHPQFRFGRTDVAALYKAAGPNFQTAEQLPGLCVHALEGEDGHAAARAAIVSRITARPGEATPYAVDVLLRGGRVSGPHSPGWQRLRKMAAP